MHFLWFRRIFRQDGAKPQGLRGKKRTKGFVTKAKKSYSEIILQISVRNIYDKKKGHAYKNAKSLSVLWNNMKHHVTCSEVDADSVYISIIKTAKPFGLPMMFIWSWENVSQKYKIVFIFHGYIVLNKNFCTILTSV